MNNFAGDQNFLGPDCICQVCITEIIRVQSGSQQSTLTIIADIETCKMLLLQYLIILKAAYLLLTVLRFIEGLDLTEFLQCAFIVMEIEMGNNFNSLLKFYQYFVSFRQKYFPLLFSFLVFSLFLLGYYQLLII